MGLVGSIVMWSGLSGCHGPDIDDSTQQASRNPLDSKIVLIEAKSEKEGGGAVDLESKLNDQNKANEALRDRVKKLEAELKQKETLYKQKLNEVSRVKAQVKSQRPDNGK